MTPSLEELARVAAIADGGEIDEMTDEQFEPYVNIVRAVVRALEPAIAEAVYNGVRQPWDSPDKHAARLVAQITQAEG